MTTTNRHLESNENPEGYSVAFELSGESPGLAAAEANALMDIYGAGHSDCAVHPLLLLSRTDAPSHAMSSRAGLSHNVLDVWAACDGGLDCAIRALADVELPLRTDETFRVRARALKGSIRLPRDAEAMLGEAIFHRGYIVDLHQPDVEVRALFYRGGFVVGRSYPVHREGLRARSPRFKPFFYPGVVKPQFARALVNLCRMREGVLLDPACGTAGILVEAGLLGLTPMGCDAQYAMVMGARRNLAHYDLDCNVMLADGCRLPMRDGTVSAVVCDMPYGRSSRFAASSRDGLYRGFFPEASRVLAPGRRAVFCADVDISGFVVQQEFAPLELHTHRVHGSLTRHIVVCRAQ